MILLPSSLSQQLTELSFLLQKDVSCETQEEITDFTLE
jgi:hypothetical protein